MLWLLYPSQMCGAETTRLTFHTWEHPDQDFFVNNTDVTCLKLDTFGFIGC